MIKNVSLRSIYILLFNNFISQIIENDWQLKKFENGITVYTRKTVNSNFKELKATFNLKTSLNSIVALINNGESYPQWVYRCGQSVTLK